MNNNLQMKKKGSIKNKSNLEKALASAEQIPIGGLNSVFSHIQLFKSRLEGIQKYVRDKGQANKAPPPQRNQASIWSNIINSSKNNLDIRNNLQGKYKKVFDQYRASIKEQIRSEIDMKNSVIQPRSPKANQPKSQFQPQIHTFGKKKKNQINSFVPSDASDASLMSKPVVDKKPIAAGFPFGIASNAQNTQNIFNTPLQAPSGKVAINETKNMPSLFQSNISSNLSFNNPFSMNSSPFSLTPQQPKKDQKLEQTKKIEEQLKQKPNTSIKGGVILDTEGKKPAIDIYSTADWSMNRQVDKPMTEFKSTNNLFSENNPLAGQPVKQQIPPQFFNLPKKTEKQPDKIQIEEKIQNPEIKQKAKLFPNQQKQQKEAFGFNLFAKSNFGQFNLSMSSNPFSNNNKSQNQTPGFNFMNNQTALTPQAPFMGTFSNNSNFKNIFKSTLETPIGQSKEQLKEAAKMNEQLKEELKQQIKKQAKEYAKFFDESQQMVSSFAPSQQMEGIRRRRRQDLTLDQPIITQQIKEEAKNINPFSKKTVFEQAPKKSFFNVKPVQISNKSRNQDITPKNEPQPKETLTFAGMKNPNSLFSAPNSQTPSQTKPNMSSLFSQGATQNKAFTPNQNNNPFKASFSTNNNETKSNSFGFSNASSLFKNTSDSQGLFGKPKQGSLFAQPTPQDSLFGNPNPQGKSIFGNNQEQKQGGGSNQDNNDPDEQQLMRQQQMDSDPNKSNAKYQNYCESEVLFKEIALKFKRGTKETMDNIITSIQKVNKSNNLSIIARLPNKRQIFYGVYMPNVTEIIPAKDNHASLTVKKIAYTDENSKTALQMLKIKFKDETTGRRFEKILKK